MGYCADQGIGIAFYTEYGRFLARVHGRQIGNVLLRRNQYRWADDIQKSLTIARIIIAAKIVNSRAVFLRQLRNHGENLLLSQSIKKLEHCMVKCEHANDIDLLRGIEGEAAAIYFNAFDQLLRTSMFQFLGRIRRPPTDPVNALLSLVYSLITQECASALQGVQLDPYVGFLHCDRSGRPSLALDLLEEFRSAWADRFVLTLLNRKQVSPNDFVIEASGAVHLKNDIRKQLLIAFQERKQEKFIHPYLKEEISFGLLPHCQALLLARHLRGDTDYYPPYLMK